MGVFPSLCFFLLGGEAGDVRLSPSRLTQLCLSVPSDKGENGEPYQRRKGAGTSPPDGPPPFPVPKDSSPMGSSSSWRRILLMILAITIHNIPGEAQLSVHLSVCPCSPFPGGALSWCHPRGMARGRLLSSLLLLLLTDSTRVPFAEICHIELCYLQGAGAI